ncbi:MAG: hypothetical protein HQL95_08900 [Magnetococcales bacterium]|nr:hypothetical protein [Magnetococcales bacterium]
MPHERLQRLEGVEKLLRYCRNKQVVDGDIQPGAFMLRSSDNGFLSTNWLGRYSELKEPEQIKRCSNDYYNKLSIKLRDKEKRAARFAMIPVGKTVDAFKKEMNSALEAWHLRHTEFDDPSYAGLYALPEESLEAANLLLKQIERTYPGIP